MEVVANGEGLTPEQVVELLAEMLNHRVHPVIPSRGSVGASGGLAPLAHLASVLIGLGEAELDGELLPGAEALARADLTPLRLQAKEGLALINGTQMMAAYGVLAIHQTNCAKVQDPYSLRCAPQVFGAIRDGLTFARQTLEREINSATDNPLCFPETEEVISGGNFRGQPVALALDVAKLSLTQLCNFSETRSYRMLDAARSGLPPFLSGQPGLNSGYMVAQYTAASFCSENQTLAVPASIHSIPTSAGMEDFNSMGATAALHLRKIVENVGWIVAVELLCATQGVEEHRPLTTTPPQEAAIARVRDVAPRMEADRPLTAEIESVARLVQIGALRQDAS